MNSINRRQFLKTSAVVSATAMTCRLANVYAAGSDTIKIGVIGCGGRGNYDTTQCLKSSEGIKIVAMGDLFPEKVEGLHNSLKTRFPDKVDVPSDKKFSGWDAYKKVLHSDIDFVIMTQTPHFRHIHLQEAIAAGKHIFMEKPVAVDPVGVRHVIELGQQADRKGLTIVAGTQMRRIPHLVDGVKRIHDGAIGRIVGGQCVRMGGALMNWGIMKRDPKWSDMEWQIRRWLFYTWGSGDFIVEQHVHNLDIVNWVMGGPPVACVGVGGRINRTDEIYGNIYDHFSVEYEYANGVKISYMGSQIDGVTSRCDQSFVGTKGTAYTDFANVIIKGDNPYKYEGERYDPCIRQHADQIDAIRNGKKLNEAKRIAESSMTAILGRMSAYTGRAMKFSWAMKASRLDLSPEKYEFGPLPVRPVAIPGKTKII